MGRHERSRDEAIDRYPALAQFFGCHLNEDWPEMSGTPEKAVENAIAGYPSVFLQQARHELAALLEKYEDETGLPDILDGLGVNLYFRQPAEARSFAVDVERRLLAAIQGHYRQQRRKG